MYVFLSLGSFKCNRRIMGLGVGGSGDMICIFFRRSPFVVWKTLYGRRVERRINRNRETSVALAQKREDCVEKSP